MLCTISYLLSENLSYCKMQEINIMQENSIKWFQIFCYVVTSVSLNLVAQRKQRNTLSVQGCSTSTVHTMLSGVKCSITTSASSKEWMGRNRNPRPCEEVIFKNLKPPFKWTKLLEWQQTDVTLSLYLVSKRLQKEKLHYVSKKYRLRHLVLSL